VLVDIKILGHSSVNATNESAAGEVVIVVAAERPNLPVGTFYKAKNTVPCFVVFVLNTRYSLGCTGDEINANAPTSLLIQLCAEPKARLAIEEERGCPSAVFKAPPDAGASVCMLHPRDFDRPSCGEVMNY
jgi:hypothetical protein